MNLNESTIIIIGYFLVALIYIILSTIISSNKSNIRIQGYSEAVAEWIRNKVVSQIIYKISFTIVAGLTATLITYLLFGDLGFGPELSIFFLIILIVLVPGVYYDEKRYHKELFTIIARSENKTIIDLKFKTLHKIFIPLFELCWTILIVVFVLTILKNQYFIIIHLVLPWLAYLGFRSAKLQTSKRLRKNLTSLLLILIINYCFIIFLLWRHLECCSGELSSSNVTLLIVSMIAIGLKLVINSTFGILTLPKQSWDKN